MERQITQNPSEDWVRTGAISPDGKTIAYQDRTGLYLRSTDSGEVRQVALPREFEDRIFDLNWFPDGTKLLGIMVDADERGGPDANAWAVSVNGDTPPRMLWRCVQEGTVSPDGRSLAYLGDGSPSNRSFGIWVVKFDTASERQLGARGKGGWFFSPVWSPDAQWIAYVHDWNTPRGVTSAIEVQPANGGAGKTVLAETQLPEGNSICDLYAGFSCLNWSKNGHIFLSAREVGDSPSSDSNHSLWEIPVDPRTASAAGKPRRIAHWEDLGADNLSTSADGKHLVFLRTKNWSDVYLAEVYSEGNKIGQPRRLTLDNRGSSLSAWMPDSQSILFSSGRTARGEIFKQQVNDTIATALVQSSQADLDDAVMTPDGLWLLYREFNRTRPNVMAWSGARLMRRRPGGGPSELVFEKPLDMQWGYSCGVQPQSSCVLSQVEGTDYVFYALDPVKGKGPKLGRVKQGHPGRPEGWALSPDGLRIASVTEDSQIEVLSIRDGSWSEIKVDPRWKRLWTIAGAPDGRSFYAVRWSAGSPDLIHIRFDGTVTPLLHRGRAEYVHNLIPSPDGKYLAFEGGSRDSNIWILENF